MKILYLQFIFFFFFLFNSLFKVYRLGEGVVGNFRAIIEAVTAIGPWLLEELLIANH